MFEKEKSLKENLAQGSVNEPVNTAVNSLQSNSYAQEPVNIGGSINGKFKSVADLAKAYSELERKYGSQAQELGQLRQIAEEHFAHIKECEKTRQQLEEFQKFILSMPERFHSDNYLKNKEFRNILKAAYEGFGSNLNVESLVDMIEKYMDARASLAKKVDSFNSEADSATDLLGYTTNGHSKFKGPKKRLSDMTPEELDKALDELM